MASGWGVGIVGGLAIALAVLGLLLDPLRPGPFDVDLAPDGVPIRSTGGYNAQGVGTSPLCLATACPASTSIDLRVEGLPPLPYTARLEGSGGTIELGPLALQPDGSQRLQWSRAEDHTGKSSLVLLVAGSPVHAWPVGPSATPRSLDASGVAALPEPPTPTVHVGQIGAVTVSAVAQAQARWQAPAGWTLSVLLEGDARRHVLGAFEPDGQDGLVLDARVERVRLADDQRLVAMLHPDGTDPTRGFPVASGLLGGS